MTNPTFSLGIYAFSNVRAFLAEPAAAVRRTGPDRRHQSRLAVDPLSASTRRTSIQLTPTAHAQRRAALRGDDDADRSGRARLGADQPDRSGADGRRAVSESVDASTCRRASGAAWDVFGDGSTSVRGGYGLYFNTNNQQNLIVTVTNPPATPRFVIANPTFPDPAVRARRRQHDPSGAVGARRAPRLHMWNVNVQRSLPAEPRSRRSATPGRAARTCSATPTSTSRRRPPTADGRYFFAAGLPRPNRSFGTIELKSSDGDSLVQGARLRAAAHVARRASRCSRRTPGRASKTRRRRRRSSPTRPTARRSRFRSSIANYNKGPADWDTRAQLGAERRSGTFRSPAARPASSAPCSTAGR